MFKIAFIEDDSLLASSVKEFLISKGYDVSHFENGLSFIDNIQLSTFNLIILDLIMNNIDGFDVLEYLHSINSKIPIIVVSGVSEIASLENAFRLGASDYVKKPVHLRELLARIQRFDKSSLRIQITEDIYFDKVSNLLIVNKEDVYLTPKLSDLMRLFCSYPNEVLKYELIQISIWGNCDDVMVNTLATYVRDLNKLIKPAKINNISKVGYKLVINL